MEGKSLLNLTTNILLKLMASQFNLRPSLRDYLKSIDGWMNFSVGFQTDTRNVEQAIIFNEGKVKVVNKIPENVDVKLIFTNDQALKEMLRTTPNEVLNLILKNKMILEGNFAYLQLFNFLLSLLIGKKHQKMLDKASQKDKLERQAKYSVNNTEISKRLKDRNKYRLKGTKEDKGVKYLDDPYLSEYAITDFPRLKEFVDIHFNIKPAVCIERPRLLTEWFRENGFEYDINKQPWLPVLRQAKAFRYLMENKQPIIRENDLIAGTTTSKEIGVLLYPDAQGTMFWGELGSVDKRILNPYTISDEEIKILHHQVFPFWVKRNFRELARDTFDYPLCQKIDERFVAYFVWKSVGISHTIPDLPRILNKGAEGIINDINEKLQLDTSLDEERRSTLEAMKITLEGVIVYANNLSREASRLAAIELNPNRKAELIKVADICKKVPSKACETLDEAVNCIWIVWVAIHMENSNTGFSLGRLDQWMQPYFEKDMEKFSTKEEKQAYIKHAIELVGCFIMRCTDHLPLVPDIGNYLFGGSSSDQAITLGGVTPEGEDAVNDMTYIFLKLTEMLAVKDPNFNARFNLEHNSDTYLKRLCEVNYITTATPSMHGDEAVFKSLKKHGYPIQDIRDWSAVGCVEPTISGKHFGHTGSILMNMVAALEMALNDGCHPLMNWDFGPKTGKINDFNRFEDFFKAFEVQISFLIDNAVELNAKYAKIHSEYRPTPLLSALMGGCIDKAKDVTKGGALYNTSGSSNIGLADVTDSLLVIKKLVFDENKISLTQLKKSIDNNFEDDSVICSMVMNKVPKFGSGNTEAVEMANRVSKVIHDCYSKHINPRGGRYTTGFWSMSQHVAYGTLSGALPSGKLAEKAFTPGLTPHPVASKNYLDNITDVAQLNPEYMDNNIAFNVKLVPSVYDNHEKIIDLMYSYVKTYFSIGGMQIQFNVVDSNTLRDAMAHPENYKNLLVRISGYNAYFVTLNKEMQIELIERAEYGMRA